LLYNLPIKELGRLLDSDTLVIGEITNSEKIAHSQALSEEVGGQIDTPPMF
jgi:hypothetical protein